MTGYFRLEGGNSPVIKLNILQIEYLLQRDDMVLGCSIHPTCFNPSQPKVSEVKLSLREIKKNFLIKIRTFELWKKPK